MLEMLLALDFVREYRQKTFEANGLVRPMRLGGSDERREKARAASPLAARPAGGRLRALVPRRHAA